jgi:hypothetical protein
LKKEPLKISDYKFKKVQESQPDEFAAEQKFRYLEEKYLKELAELKVFDKKIYTLLMSIFND